MKMDPNGTVGQAVYFETGQDVLELRGRPAEPGCFVYDARLKDGTVRRFKTCAVLPERTRAADLQELK